MIRNTSSQIHINILGSEIWVGVRRSNEAIVPITTLVKEAIKKYEDKDSHPARLIELRNSLKKSLDEVNKAIKNEGTIVEEKIEDQN